MTWWPEDSLQQSGTKKSMTLQRSASAGVLLSRRNSAELSLEPSHSPATCSTLSQSPASCPSHSASWRDNILNSPWRLSPRRAFHPNIEGPVVCHTLSDLGYSNKGAASGSSFACTDPFPMLTGDACEAIKNEVFCKSGESRSYDLSSYAELWNSDKFSNLINRVIDVPVKVEETKLGTSTQVHARAAGCVGGEFMSSDWHRDECTFVCVIMLSDVPEEKRGAETILKKADESEESLLFPVGSKGHAYMLHGSHIQHRFCPVEFDCVYITIRLQPADGWGSMDEEPSIVSDDGDDQFGLGQFDLELDEDPFTAPFTRFGSQGLSRNLSSFF